MNFYDYEDVIQRLTLCYSIFRKIYNNIQNAFDIRIAELDKTIIK